jgi:phospholipid transport system transporter-binding protein
MSQTAPQVVITAPGRITVSSALTFATARRVYQAGVAAFIRDGSSLLIVDCSGVSQVDSAGLAVLLEWRRWTHLQGKHLKFCTLPAQIKALARLSEVSELLAEAAA